MEDIHSMQQSEEEPKELFTTSFTSSANESASGKNSGIAVQPSTVAYACQEPRQLEQHHLNPQWPDLQVNIFHLYLFSDQVSRLVNALTSIIIDCSMKYRLAHRPGILELYHLLHHQVII